MKTCGAKKIKNGNDSPWGCIGGSTPPQSRVRLLPQNMNKPLWWRIKEWFK